MNPELAAIDERMKAQHKSRADLGRLLGLDSAQVSRIFSGKRRIQLHEARQIESWLAGEGPAAGASGAVLPLPGMVPLYGWVGAASPSRLVLAEQNLRGYVPMHPAQSHVRDAFALEVADISMSPRYEPGEIVYVAPNRWPRPNQDCVLVTTDGQGLLKRFVRRSDEGVVLHQLNPDGPITIETEKISAIHSVVAAADQSPNLVHFDRSQAAGPPATNLRRLYLDCFAQFWASSRKARVEIVCWIGVHRLATMRSTLICMIVADRAASAARIATRGALSSSFSGSSAATADSSFSSISIALMSLAHSHSGGAAIPGPGIAVTAAAAGFAIAAITEASSPAAAVLIAQIPPAARP